MLFPGSHVTMGGASRRTSQKNTPPKRGPKCFIELQLLVISVAYNNLSAKFAAGKLHGMYVRVGCALPYGAQCGSQITRCYPLSSRTGDIGCGDGAFE